MTRNLIFEIGVEEIPARFMTNALKQIEDLTITFLTDKKIAHGKVEALGTPRRLTLMVADLAEEQEDVVIEVKGPAKKAALDADGKPTRAIEGFCKSQGVDFADLIEVELKGVTYLYAKKEEKGVATATLLPELFNLLFSKVYFPKPMRWAYEEMRFARPIRFIVALFGDEVVPFEIAGVKSGRITRGHRFLGSDNIEITAPETYLAQLEENYCIVDQNRRREMAWTGIQNVAASLGGIVKCDEELLEEVTYLLEYPTALAGKFNEKFLEMPVEMIITPMREHQRYFPVYKEDGTLLNNFITVRNGIDAHMNTVIAGNEKVLSARLSDASFFWTEDCKKNLEENLPRLQAIVFHEKLGSLSAKVERVTALAEVIATTLNYPAENIENTLRTAKLAKADLVSNAVYEFPELQGIMGKYYARVHGEKDEVATAIEEHYLPRFAGDNLPQTKAGIAVAIADRLDSLVGFFAQNMIPTGSQDPYALRRSATGVAQIIINHQLTLDLAELIETAYNNFNIDFACELSGVEKTLQGFFANRLDNILSEQKVSYDVINAVLANPTNDLKSSYNKALHLKQFKEDDICTELMKGLNRANNLLKNKEVLVNVDPQYFVEDIEKTLYANINQAKTDVAELIAKEDYFNALSVVGKMRQVIDEYFDNIMVMADDEAIRNNRLAQLKELVGLVAPIGKLTELK